MQLNKIVNPANPIWNPWANDDAMLELYRKRCRLELPEMDCAVQAATIIKELASKGETLLDAGCGAGHFYHSFLNQQVPIKYYGIDYTPEMIALAKQEMEAKFFDEQRFFLHAIEDLEESFDNIICINVLSNSPHYAKCLERLLNCCNKRLILRENMGESLIVRYTPDQYLNEDKRHMRVYHNRYPIDEVKAFMQEHGFKVRQIKDERTQDGEEMVCDIPHTWRILLAERVE